MATGCWGLRRLTIYVKITATQKGAAETGLISRLLGGEQARFLPEPVSVERAAIETGLVDAAEVLEDYAALQGVLVRIGRLRDR
ncbi:hypothetical protein [Streptomyces mirabilis]|uniref:hypothetical protein n=1 Tax=Streptomyces mirabilis TaxID=68239 RepID=UPI0034250F62